jgi:hypothetical protein
MNRHMEEQGEQDDDDVDERGHLFSTNERTYYAHRSYAALGFRGAYGLLAWARAWACGRSTYRRTKKKRKEKRHVQAEQQQCSVHATTTATMIGTLCLSENFTDN